MGSNWITNSGVPIITFSTIGDGALSPADDGARLLVGIESLAGAILVALLIFVLGRRVAR